MSEPEITSTRPLDPGEPRRSRRPSPVTLVALLAAFAIGAFLGGGALASAQEDDGGDPAPEAPVPDPERAEELEAFRQCLADNGVELPEPQAPAEGERGRGGRGMRPLGPPDGVDPEVWEQAHEACADLAPGAAERAAFRQCLAGNGVELPEPEAPADGEGATGMRPPRHVGPPEGVDEETWQAALEACRELAPHGRGSGAFCAPGGRPGAPNGPATPNEEPAEDAGA